MCVEDEMGNSQDLPQGEGREQGDSLMPLLFSMMCTPQRVLQDHRILEEELLNHAQIFVYHGKTQVWNRGRVPPPVMDILTSAARRLKPEAVVWRGDTSLPRCQQEVKVLGVPVGQPEFVVSPWNNIQLSSKDPQAAWLLLLMCAGELLVPDLTVSIRTSP